MAEQTRTPLHLISLFLLIVHPVISSSIPSSIVVTPNTGVTMESKPLVQQNTANFYMGEKRLSSRTVTTKYGSLRGFTLTLANRSPVEVFQGVPYASPPSGRLRFMPPRTPDVWTGIRNSDHVGAVCPQNLMPNPVTPHQLRYSSQGSGVGVQQSSHQSLSSIQNPKKLTVEEILRNETELFKILMTPAALSRLKTLFQNQSEDCLFLDIYTPVSALENVQRNSGTSRVPVIVFIPGDSFSSLNSGSAYDGSVLASYGNIVVVTINYRLGVLGFLSGVNTGNRGSNNVLMDQIAALHWIQENISEFGGDPSNVTITGHGYGAACVNLLMLTDLGRGLFHRAIANSVSATTSSCSMASTAAKYAREVASFLSCPSDGKKMTQMVECLRKKSVKELLAAESFLFTNSNRSGTVKGPQQAVAGSTIRFPMKDIFSIIPYNGNNKTTSKISGNSHTIDLSQVVRQQNAADHWSEESSSSSSSSVSSDLRSDSNAPGNNGNIVFSNNKNREENKSRGVSSESRNGANNQTSGSYSGYTTALAIIVIGVTFLLVNILLLLREFYKRDNRKGLPKTKDTIQQQQQQHHIRQSSRQSSLSLDNSPKANQLHIIESHPHQHRLLLNESLEDLSPKPDDTSQQRSDILIQHTDSCSQQHEFNRGTSVLSFHPEIISGHHLTAHSTTNTLTRHPHISQPVMRHMIEDDDSDNWNSFALYTQQHGLTGLHVLDSCSTELQSPVGVVAPSIGTRVSTSRDLTSGSSFNSGSDSFSSTGGSILNHPNHVHHQQHHHHPSSQHRIVQNEFSKSTLTRGDGCKKVSFVNPTESLIIYDGGGGSEIKSDTQV